MDDLNRNKSIVKTPGGFCLYLSEVLDSMAVATTMPTGSSPVWPQQRGVIWGCVGVDIVEWRTKSQPKEAEQNRTPGYPGSYFLATRLSLIYLPLPYR